MLRFLSLRTRLTLFTSAALIFLLIVITGIVQTAISAFVQVESGRQLEQRAALVADLVHRAADGSLVVPNLSDLSRNGMIVQVFNAAGQLVFSSTNAGQRQLPPADPQFRPVFRRGIQLVVAERPVREGTEIIGSVRVASGPGVVTAFRAMRTILVGIFVLGVPASVMTAWIFARRTVQPLEQLTAAASGIAQSRDLSRRVETGRRPDELGRLAATFNTMLDELEQADREREEVLAAQRRFLADASHNLRTPLTIILGHMELLRRIGDDPQALGLARAEIEGEARRMSRLVSDLLILARSDAGADVPREPVLIGDLLTDLVRRYAARHADLSIGAQGLELLEGRAVDGHGPYLEQLFRLLLDNACKYTPAGGQVAVRLQVEGDEMRVEVADTGIGIPAAALPNVFERFYRAPNVAARDGVGLGLAIAQSIVHSHGGSIAVKSAEGQGSTFTVTLPLLG